MHRYYTRFALFIVSLVLTASLAAQTVNQIPKWTDTSGTLGASVVAEIPAASSQHPTIIRIGTTTASGGLHIAGAANGDVFAGMGVDPATGPSFNFGYGGNTYGRSAGFFNVRADTSATAPNPSLRFATAGQVHMIITADGKVGIGYGAIVNSVTTVPTEKLGVAGNIHATGNITADGTLFAKFQDIAEWVPATTDMAPGTVVVLNPERNNEVMASASSYDTAVAGVVSAEPGLSLGIRGAGMEQIATTGRVKVRIDAKSAPIRVGDLLVTGDQAGTAMRSEPMNLNGRKFHQPGTIIGKALEPHKGGEGEILVLLSLQ